MFAGPRKTARHFESVRAVCLGFLEPLRACELLLRKLVLTQLFPVNAFKERVGFELGYIIIANPLGRCLGQEALDQILRRLFNAGVLEGDVFLLGDVVVGLKNRVTLERGISREELVYDYAERPQIAAVRHFDFRECLWSNVLLSPHHGKGPVFFDIVVVVVPDEGAEVEPVLELGRFGLNLFVEDFAGCEINQLEVHFRIKNYVSRLQVSVDDLHLPQIGERVHDLGGELAHHRRAELLVLE